MTKTFYISLDADNIIRDVISFPYGDYIPVELPNPLPVGINGGWFRWDGETATPDETLRPIDKDEEIESLKQAIAELTILIAGGM